MSANFFYFFLTIVVLFVLGFVGFYSYRLITARGRTREETDRRFERMMGSGGVAGRVGPGMTAVGGAGGGERAPATASPAASTTRVHDRGPGLRTFTEETVFMKRDRSGEVVFQVGEKPAMPLKYLLDPAGRKALFDVAMRATADYGDTWSLLAAEDDEGRLTLTRLS